MSGPYRIAPHGFVPTKEPEQKPVARGTVSNPIEAVMIFGRDLGMTHVQPDFASDTLWVGFESRDGAVVWFTLTGEEILAGAYEAVARVADKFNRLNGML